jgi:hypothetical protein
LTDAREQDLAGIAFVNGYRHRHRGTLSVYGYYKSYGAQLWRAAKYNNAAGKSHLTNNRHSRPGSKTQRFWAIRTCEAID